MDCDPKKSAVMPLFPAAVPEYFLPQIQSFMMIGKAIETITLNQARQVFEGSYSQTVKLLEEVDNSLGRASESVDASLCFPFDIMDYASRTASDGWRTIVGLETTSELKLAEKIDEQNKFSLRIERQLSNEIAALTQSLSEKDAELLQQQSEPDKARKAKQAVQRARRKLKAELEASDGETSRLKTEVEAVSERYDQQLSENSLLQAQKQQVDLELAKARQEKQQLITDAEQMTTKVDALTVEQEKMLAEKDGLQKRIEELQRQLEHSSHYTE